MSSPDDVVAELGTDGAVGGIVDVDGEVFQIFGGTSRKNEAGRDSPLAE